MEVWKTTTTTMRKNSGTDHPNESGSDTEWLSTVNVDCVSTVRSSSLWYSKRRLIREVRVH
jgi:hypothetical protein